MKRYAFKIRTYWSKMTAIFLVTLCAILLLAACDNWYIPNEDTVTEMVQSSRMVIDKRHNPPVCFLSYVAPNGTLLTSVSCESAVNSGDAIVIPKCNSCQFGKPEKMK